jgi:site-specific DNA-methyltransferase (cytosine-N4-specific)
MPVALPEFFVKLLTDRDDLVVDPFAGSNATGAAAERLGRRWMAVEPDKRHVDGSRGRFAKVRANV